jgi:hypothetical protein
VAGQRNDHKNRLSVGFLTSPASGDTAGAGRTPHLYPAVLVDRDEFVALRCNNVRIPCDILSKFVQQRFSAVVRRPPALGATRRWPPDCEADERVVVEIAIGEFIDPDPPAGRFRC